MHDVDLEAAPHLGQRLFDIAEDRAFRLGIVLVGVIGVEAGVVIAFPGEINRLAIGSLGTADRQHGHGGASAAVSICRISRRDMRPDFNAPKNSC